MHPEQGHSLLNEAQGCSLSTQSSPEQGTALAPRPGQGRGHAVPPPRC